MSEQRRPRRHRACAGRVLSWLSSAGLAIASCAPLDIRLFPDDPDAAIELPADSGTQLPVQVAEPDPDPAPPPDAGSAAADANATTDPDPCVPGALACEACVRAASCPQGRVCHPRSGDCVVPCTNGVPSCPGGSVCAGSLGVCVDCLDATQCTGASARVCDTERNVCVECVTSSDCTRDPLGYPICMPGLYRCGCTSSADCRGGSCETSEGHCDD